jgi:hypothetical protein
MPTLRLAIRVQQVPHEADVRDDITVGMLIDEIHAEFDSELGTHFNYGERGYIWLPDSCRALNESRTIRSLYLQENTTLIFGYDPPRVDSGPITRSQIDNRPPESIKRIVRLIDRDKTSPRNKRPLTYTIETVPVFIGRQIKTSPGGVHRINLQREHYPGVYKFISREHLAILRHPKSKKFYIYVPPDDDQTRNPVYLNDRELQAGIAYPLQHSDYIQILSEENLTGEKTPVRFVFSQQ